MQPLFKIRVKSLVALPSDVDLIIGTIAYLLKSSMCADWTNIVSFSFDGD